MSNYRRYYLENRYIFITVVTYNRIPILIENIDLLRDCFMHVKQSFNFEIFASVVLPDHFHLILKSENPDDFYKIIGSVKRKFTQLLYYNKNEISLSESRIKRNEKGIWQRRFYEHIIRNEKDLNIHLDYIHYNPVKHGYSKNVKDWEYSSFHKFVKSKNYEPNWGCFDEVKHIESVNLE